MLAGESDLLYVWHVSCGRCRFFCCDYTIVPGVSLISGEWKWCSNLKNLLTSEISSVSCAWGAFNTRRMSRYCNNYRLQYWTRSNRDILKSIKLILSKCWFRAPRCHQCALSSWVQVWGKPEFSYPHFHSPSVCPYSVLMLPQSSPAKLWKAAISDSKFPLVPNLSPSHSRNVCPSTPMTQRRGTAHLRMQLSSSA